MKQEKDYVAKWEQAGLADDFAFGEVMKRGNSGLNLLRAIYPNLNITGIGKVNAQEEIRQSRQGHDVVLDLYFEDDQRRIFDVEMQRENRKGFWSRIWHYLLYLESQALQKGEAYEDRRPVHLAFLMSYDAMKRNKRIYHSQILFDDSEVPLKTSMTLLNSQGKVTEVTPELQDVYHLMNGKDQAVVTPFGRHLSQEIELVKLDPQKERKYMLYSLKIEEDLADARAKEKRENAIAMAKQLFKIGFDVSEVRRNLEATFQRRLAVDEIDAIVKQAQQTQSKKS